MIKAIWAMDRNNLVGKGNLLAWHYKEDLKFFKEMTKGKEVIMGDNTYMSLLGYYGEKPLPFGKINIATLDPFIKIDGINIVSDVVSFVKDFPKDKELMVIGGKTIYDLTLQYCDIAYVTHIDADHEGDVYFHPNLDNFDLVESKVSGILSFNTYKNRKEE